ncbi:unnamed protein product [Pelagomonas calceolata]|uniref:Uncharacterized protein n=1 Tax=Pelagomonas calceolata TaxID=35677 RepID=A0A8J2SFF6_9STRA|nr:unnamed protein product [Pelagomonas calceolata]
MSVVETIRGLRKMSLAADDDGAAATPPPSPRNSRWPADGCTISIATVVEVIGGLDGLRAILTKYWRSDRIDVTMDVWEVHMPRDMVDLLIPDLEEALCRGFLDGRRAVDMAVCRVELLIEENITLPLTPVSKSRVVQLIREREEYDWKQMIVVSSVFAI